MPPPLPATLLSRLQSTVDPTTGVCPSHPTVQLCELVQSGSRWVMRRPMCYKCARSHKSPVEDEESESSDPIIVIRPFSSRQPLPPPPPKCEAEKHGLSERRRERVVVDNNGSSANNNNNNNNAIVVKNAVVTNTSTAAEDLLHCSFRTVDPENEQDPLGEDGLCNGSCELDDMLSETSSISTASAKRYPMQPAGSHCQMIIRTYGELQGVIGETPITDSRYPPKDIDIHVRRRSRSMSLPRNQPAKELTRQVATVPSKHQKKAVWDQTNKPEPNVSTEHTNARRGRSRRNDPKCILGNTTHPDTIENSNEKKNSHHRRCKSNAEVKMDPNMPHPSITVYSPPPSMLAMVQPPFLKSRSPRHHRHPHRDDCHILASTPHLAASTARMSRRSAVARDSKSLRRGVQSKQTQDDTIATPSITSRELSKVTSKQPNDQGRSSSVFPAKDSLSKSNSGVNNVRRSSSRSNRRAILEEASKCCSVLNQVSEKITPSGSCSKGERSRYTTSTQAMSLSSGDLFTSTGAEDRKSSCVLHHDNIQEAEEELDAPVVIYKKRANRINKTKESCDMSNQHHCKPLPHIAVSIDERSHASSISSSSALDEEMHVRSKDIDKVGKSGGKDRAVTMLKDIKGLASRKKAAMNGWKGTSRKWQSALFM